MTIEALMKVLPPPAEPFEAFDGPWDRIEAQLGTALPQDYKDFVRLYGLGEFMYVFVVNVPGASVQSYNFEFDVRFTATVFADDDEMPYVFWPQPFGLLPVGSSTDGSHIFWLRTGSPENWTIVYWDRGTFECETFDCSLTEFLAGLVTGEILPKDFPADYFGDDPPSFAPFSGEDTEDESSSAG